MWSGDRLRRLEHVPQHVTASLTVFASLLVHDVRREVILVTDDVGLALLVKSDITRVYPFSQEVRCALVLPSLFVQLLELLLQIPDLIVLLLDLGLVFAVLDLTELLVLVLIMQLCLCAPPLASRLQEVCTNALARYKQR